jgi:hypothetical protein
MFSATSIGIPKTKEKIISNYLTITPSTNRIGTSST